MFLFFREKKRECEREELWKRLELLGAAHPRNKPLVASMSVDNNNKNTNSSTGSITTAAQ